jgi:2-polyprenyl-6-methoxyphenol hydroxylase-like FAD-dependent oxidoreductase
MSNWGCLYQILRANFDGLRSEAVPNPPGPKIGDGQVDYQSGKRVTGLAYDKDKGRVQVQYVDVLTGESKDITSEMVVAADGLHSTVRNILQVPTRRMYAGYIGWRGTVSESLLTNDTIQYFSNRLNFTLMGGTYFIR